MFVIVFDKFTDDYTRLGLRVHDVDLNSIAHHCQILGEDRDTAFPFLVLVVHDSFPRFICLLGVAEYIRLAEEGVDQRSLSVVDVRNHGNVSVWRRHTGTMWLVSIGQVTNVLL